MLKQNKSRGQALVEFALAATLIFFLLAAAVDLGFMFFALQGLHNAAQEGGTYGSRWLISNQTTGLRTLNVNAIRDNVRHESGSRGGIGFVNLLDLNNDHIPDVSPDGPIGDNCAKCQINPATGRPVVYDFIQVSMIRDANLNGNPLDDGTAPNFTTCTNAASALCYIYVSVSFNYKLNFPLSPTFARERMLRSSFTMRLRDDMARTGESSVTPVFATLTPTNTPIPTNTPTNTPVPTNTPTNTPAGPAGTNTPTPTPCNKVVPNLVGTTTNGHPSSAEVWAAAGFSGALIQGNVGNYTVATQSLPAGSTAPCTSTIVVYKAVPTNTPTATRTPTSTPTVTPCNKVVPNLVGSSTNGNPSTAAKWAAAGFTGAVVKGSTGNYTVASQSLTAGSTAPCTSSITVYK